MSVVPDPRGGRGGTRFRLFPQSPWIDPSKRPETVHLSPPAGVIGPGPADGRMYVIDPVDKRRPYGLSVGPYGTPQLDFPPWRGPIHPPAVPDGAGHFDHLEVGTAEFELAHIYGCVHRVLDIWESYFGRRIDWHFGADQDRLEIVRLPWLDNARAGYGFVEVGSDFGEAGEIRPFSLNFDVLAHELGHLIIYAELGVPTIETEQSEYFGFHESAADLVALLAAIHFDSVVDELLDNSRGNLYTFNELNRFGELSADEQIRIASNGRKLSDFAAGWSDEHDLSEPLTGAVFDILVDLFHGNLVAEGLIGAGVQDLLDRIERRPDYEAVVQPMFDAAYGRDPLGFREALLAARDRLGILLAEAWGRLSPHHLNYDDVARAMLAVDREMSGGRYGRAILDSFLWRDIGAAVVGPRLSPPDEASHACSSRTVTPEDRLRLPRPSYRERWHLARGGGRTHRWPVAPAR